MMETLLDGLGFIGLFILPFYLVQKREERK